MRQRSIAMIDQIHVHEVGAPDPELPNSPIVEETDEDFDAAGQVLREDAVCYFNGRRYPDGQYVRRGAELLQCKRGTWVQQGPGDPANPRNGIERTPRRANPMRCL